MIQFSFQGFQSEGEIQSSVPGGNWGQTPQRLSLKSTMTEVLLFLPRFMHPPTPNREADMW